MGILQGLCWYKNGKASGKPKKPLRRFLKNILVSAFALTFFSSLYSYSSEEILAKAVTNFNLALPGFQRVLNAANGGKYFELETALYLQKEEPEETIEGFDLEINFYAGKIRANIDGHAVDLPTTEFDVITRNYVIECKSGWNTKRGLEGHLKQFIKEQNMIAWMGALAEDLAKDRVRIGHRFKNSSKSVFSVEGRCTFGKKIELTCSWVNKNRRQHSHKDCIDCFVDIVQMLSEKSLLVFFKSSLLDGLAEGLQAFDIEVYDSIEYVRHGCSGDVLVDERLVSSLSQLVLC